MLTHAHQPVKVAIIGTGRVGALCAYALQMCGLVSEIVLINANRQRTEGEAILRDESNVLTVSSVIHVTHRLNDIALSLPCVINRQGITSTLDLPLSSEEENGLQYSAQVLREAITSLNLEDGISVGRIPSARPMQQIEVR